MRTEKMGTEKMGTEKMGTEKMGTEKMGTEKMGTEKMRTGKVRDVSLQRICNPLVKVYDSLQRICNPLVKVYQRIANPLKRARTTEGQTREALQTFLTSQTQSTPPISSISILAN
jgi:hypothetical protein